MSDLCAMDGLTFETDRNGIIKDIGSNNWNAFAIHNGAPEIEAATVLNRNLFDFIEGTQVQDQLKKVMQRAAFLPDGGFRTAWRFSGRDGGGVERASLSKP